jgi:hypothetical protein
MNDDLLEAIIKAIISSSVQWTDALTELDVKAEELKNEADELGLANVPDPEPASQAMWNSTISHVTKVAELALLTQQLEALLEEIS